MACARQMNCEAPLAMAMYELKFVVNGEPASRYEKNGMAVIITKYDQRLTKTNDD